MRVIKVNNITPGLGLRKSINSFLRLFVSMARTGKKSRNILEPET